MQGSKLGSLVAAALTVSVLGCSDGGGADAANGGAAGSASGSAGMAQGGSGTGSGGVAGGGGGAGGSASSIDEYGCDIKTQVSCNGQCFSMIGEEKAGCRVLSMKGAAEVLHVDGDDLFYATTSSLRVVRLAAAEDEVITDKPSYIEEIRAAGDFVYVATAGDDSGTFGPGTVQRAPRAGGDTVALIQGVTGPRNLAVIGSTVYFTWGLGSLMSVPADGSAMAADSMVDASSLLVDGEDLIFAEAKFTNFPIKVATAGDVANATVLVPEVFDPTLIAVLDGNVHYFDDDGNYLRVPKAGGAPEMLLAAAAGVTPDFWSAHDVLTATTAAGKTTLDAMPVAGGEPVEVGTFAGSVKAATSSATHYFVGTNRGIFQVAR